MTVRAARPKCRLCGHSAHNGACPRKGPFRCVPLDLGDGGVGWACGWRPPCPCPWRTCGCGAAVALASGECTDTLIERGSAGDEAGELAVRLTPAGELACRLLDPGGDLAGGEWRGRSHVGRCPGDRWRKLVA